MPNKLAGIIGCLIVAALVNVGLRTWISDLAGAAEPTEQGGVLDGNSLVSSHHFSEGCMHYAVVVDTIARPNALNDLVCAYNSYIRSGDGADWLVWRDMFFAEYGNILANVGPPAPNWAAQVLRVQDHSAPSRWIALLSLIAALLILWSKRLKEYHLITPVFYFAVAGVAVWTYGAMSAPLFLMVALLGMLAYAFSIRLMLPLYRTEWVRSLRPLMTFWLFLLGAIAWRGPEWVDYQFWTSDWFRLIMLTTALFSLYFHWEIFSRALANAKLDATTRVFAYAMPLGSTAVVMGLALGFWGQGDQHALIQINRELLILPPQWMETMDPNLPFWLLFAGIALLIIGGIGYLIQGIAR